MIKKQGKTVITKYITKSIAFDVETSYGEEKDATSIRLIGTFMPETKSVRLDHIGQLQGQDVKLDKVLGLARALTDLVKEIVHKEHLRELAEGFGESITQHKKK